VRDAGFNVRHIQHADVTFAVDTDVPVCHTGPSHSFRPGEVREPELRAAAEEIYGQGRFVFVSQGRSAELAVAAAVAKRFEGGAFRVLTTGLFPTTERAWQSQGATIEIGPRARPASSDIDMDWLRESLHAPGNTVVYLEAANNGAGGWPLTPAHVDNVRRVCDASGTLFGLDATRLVSNCSCLDSPLFETVKAVASAAHILTLSSAKEAFVCHGALARVPDFEMEKSIYEMAHRNGTALEPFVTRAQLAEGLARMPRESRAYSERRQLLIRLSESLHGAGLHALDPVGAHAAFVALDDLMLSTTPERTRHIAIEATLFQVSGIRARASYFPRLGRHLLRVTWPLQSVDASDVPFLAKGIVELFSRAAEIPNLDEEPDGWLHPLQKRYRVA
jgi:tryptophanase